MNLPAQPELPPGLYESVVTDRLSALLDAVPDELIGLEDLDNADGDVMLAGHVGRVVLQLLRSVPEADRPIRQVELANALLSLMATAAPLLGERIDDRSQMLRSISRRVPFFPSDNRVASKMPRPPIPLSSSALLVNNRGEPGVGDAIRQELGSADRVDLVCAFIRWTGARIVLEPLRQVVARGGQVRILTTTYLGATERRAVDALVGAGVEVRVLYDVEATRLHAKAWLLHRDSGFSTAYVGSSNLSRAAMVDGLEWNVRLSEIENPAVLTAFRATFEAYWDGGEAQPYRPDIDGEALDKALVAQRTGRAIDTMAYGDGVEFVGIELEARPHQTEILYALEVERQLHDRWRNLVVAATGTGKTVVAALDYKRLRAGGMNRLLFVAHSKQILLQSRWMFRHALGDGSFGEIFVGGARPDQWDHVFASIQSLTALGPTTIAPDHFDVVIVDEFHHAEARTYSALLEHLQPKVLLGLTATPERSDGINVARWFGNRIAAELRLWEALERGLLSPFQYFGVHDDVDLSAMAWRRGGYDTGALEQLYTGNDARLVKVLHAIRRIVADPLRMRALGFCVSVAHAEWMARRFVDAGISAVAITGESASDARAAALRDLRDGKVNVVFTVDLFNEGVDVPAIDTVLFLRPTESATVFLQQLGRGLRRTEGKACLTVLDFIGNQHRRFRFDLRYSALTGQPRNRLAAAVEQGWPYLPPGCHLELDREATEVVLSNLRVQLRLNWRSLIASVKECGDVSLAEWLAESATDRHDLYRRSQGGWTALRRDAGFPVLANGPDEVALSRAIGRMLHIDDPERCRTYRRWLVGAAPPALGALGERDIRLLRMLDFDLWGSAVPAGELTDRLARLWDHEATRAELLEVLAISEDLAGHLPQPMGVALPVPLTVHTHYNRDEILAAFGVANPASVREGVKWLPEINCELLFVTLQKSEQHYSPTTRYQDYALSRDLFHWESQSFASEGSAAGQRYVHQREQGVSIVLFVRNERKSPTGMAAPYWNLGLVDYVSHRGERPMGITWRLRQPTPEDLFVETAAVLAAG